MRLSEQQIKFQVNIQYMYILIMAKLHNIITGTMSLHLIFQHKIPKMQKSQQQQQQLPPPHQQGNNQIPIQTNTYHGFSLSERRWRSTDHTCLGIHFWPHVLINVPENLTSTVMTQINPFYSVCSRARNSLYMAWYCPLPENTLESELHRTWTVPQ